MRAATNGLKTVLSDTAAYMLPQVGEGHTAHARLERRQLFLASAFFHTLVSPLLVEPLARAGTAAVRQTTGLLERKQVISSGKRVNEVGCTSEYEGAVQNTPPGEMPTSQLGENPYDVMKGQTTSTAAQQTLK